ncbi:MAG: ABC transporter permease [Planctomycetota bacterium]|jgi:oligopeptide transport system permease protein|nr:ABC transporter permease [Planctomycetota bacterium]
MGRYLLKRLIQAPIVLFLIVTCSFVLVRLAPGGPFDAERKVPPEVEAALNEQYHLDESIPMQYGRFLLDLAQGDLGPAIKYPGRSVNAIIADRLPPTLLLGGYALALAVLIGVTVGVIGARLYNTVFDHASMVFALLGISIPMFVVGPLLLLAFQTQWRLVSPPGEYGPSFAYLSLAALCLAAPFAARIARLCRAGMLEVVNQDFARTARAKGVPEWRIVTVHCLRGALTPVVSFLGPAVASVLTGSLVVESIFLLKGLGWEFVFSAINRDYTLVIGTVIVYSSLLIIANLIVDLCYGLLDPRVRYD